MAEASAISGQQAFPTWPETGDSGKSYAGRTRTMKARTVIGIGVLAALSLALAPPVSAETNSEVRDALAAQALEPVPLYPTHRPGRLLEANVSLTIDGNDYNVTWDRGCCTGAENARRGVIGLNRTDDVYA